MITNKLKWIAIALVLFSFKGEGTCSAPKTDDQPVKFVIDCDTQYQTIDNFGASDGWSFQFIGLWPKEKQAQMAEWLFSTENNANGQPKGIGLSLWRFNIGAGSTEQGAQSGIDDEWRRSECFLQPNGTYDWNKQQGQRNFLQLAKQQGVDQFLGFILSAPVYYTQNGLATNTGRDATFNIQDDKYDDFSRFLADVVQGLEQHHHIKLDHICPFNEPDGHWNWTGSGQEGTAATNLEIAKTVRLMGQDFKNRNLSTNILVSESFDYNCLYQVHPYSKANRGYQIQSFFTPDSTNTYIGNVPNVQPLMAGHSYWTNTPLTDLRKIRMELDGQLKKSNVRFWQTELCVMSNDEEIGGGHQKDLTMKTALYIARIIHHDLVFANASAWQWWRAAATGDYKDGLIYTSPAPSKLDGTYTDSKLMWALGNYSRFIRPGAKRVGVKAYDNSNHELPEGDTNPKALMVSAYQNTDGTPVVVVINYDDNEREVELKTNSEKTSMWQPYLTNDTPNSNLAPQPVVKQDAKMVIPARSIITLVGASK
jgi:hypothetical protein